MKVTIPEFEPTSREDPEVLALFADFIRETDGPLGIDLEAEIAAGPPRDLVPPGGVLLLVRIDGTPAGIGGVRHLDTDVAEVKSMYLDPAFRGHGLSRRLLAELERVAREHGCATVRLDTSDYLTEAIALYRSAGYRGVPNYNANPKANLWFERPLSDEPIQISPYDPRWPDRFERERTGLEGAIGEWVVAGIHHVGSTAVPGLDAKPIVDILAGVGSLEDSRACFEPLEGLGYLYAPHRADEMHWFCKPHPALRTHHLHLVPADSRRFADELAFRDLLRSDASIASAYTALKHELADRFRDDREAYTEAKSDFIREALNRSKLDH